MMHKFVMSPRGLMVESFFETGEKMRTLEPPDMDDLDEDRPSTPQSSKESEALAASRLAEQRQMLQEAEDEHGACSFEAAMATADLASALDEMGLHQEQLAILTSAIQTVQDHLGDSHPVMAELQVELAQAHGSLGDFRQQKSLLKKVLKIPRTSNSLVARTLVMLADAYGQLGKLQERMRRLREAVDVLRKEHGPEHMQVASALISLASAHAAMGRVAEQRAALERSLSIKERLLGADHPETRSLRESVDGIEQVQAPSQAQFTSPPTSEDSEMSPTPTFSRLAELLGSSFNVPFGEARDATEGEGLLASPGKPDGCRRSGGKHQRERLAAISRSLAWTLRRSSRAHG